MLKTRKRENDAVVLCLFSRACDLIKVNVNVHMITLQLLVNEECRTTHHGSYM